ncbi:putative quinol monooxygenase [Haliscomenobacter hydrossis]|uniref:Antibiotic biosynthesis monooxygenase n=1 Tax=Haliscomenobacter hydrossis (strain ATCC 27775 / DSM 1100 / LMG 10767 / O) TaxID=760192 RepID=F4L237_HALH1|nr:antibiotic biosynthesis monooxygenase family protein [Haliscomenobacter hydrossis]AEE51644.1 Antibiotic biosynthesis monooxygenase [Haliscomenobacter hydrossis DSM 1100]
MLKRMVKMTFQKDHIEDFLAIFEASKNLIRQFPGCRHLELLHLEGQPEVMFTFSIWEGQEALEAYRQSELFQRTWSKTKVLFAGKPEAWSMEEVAEV